MPPRSVPRLAGLFLRLTVLLTGCSAKHTGAPSAPHQRSLRHVPGGAEMTDDLAGPIVVTLDLDGVTDKAAFMERVVRALDLPAWFGRNWDALADSLADDTLWPAPAAARGLLLVVRDWPPYATARPEEWQTAREVFAKAADRMPGLSVALALGGSHEGVCGLPG